MFKNFDWKFCKKKPPTPQPVKHISLLVKGHGEEAKFVYLNKTKEENKRELSKWVDEGWEDTNLFFFLSH